MQTMLGWARFDSETAGRYTSNRTAESLFLHRSVSRSWHFAGFYYDRCEFTEGHLRDLPARAVRLRDEVRINNFSNGTNIKRRAGKVEAVHGVFR